MEIVIFGIVLLMSVATWLVYRVAVALQEKP